MEEKIRNRWLLDNTVTSNIPFIMNNITKAFSQLKTAVFPKFLNKFFSTQGPFSYWNNKHNDRALGKSGDKKEWEALEIKDSQGGPT